MTLLWFVSVFVLCMKRIYFYVEESFYFYCAAMILRAKVTDKMSNLCYDKAVIGNFWEKYRMDLYEIKHNLCYLISSYTFCRILKRMDFGPNFLCLE